MGQPNTKIQFSFKLALLEGQPIYFGYSQLAFWELVRSSPYFADIDYDPDLFYRLSVGDKGLRWLDIGPIEHESNGQGGSLERSWNRSYARFHDEWSLSGRTKLRAELKAWVPYDLNPSNRDLPDYRGVWEANVMLSDFHGAYTVQDLILRLYAGGPSNVDPTRGGQELTFRLKWAKPKVIPVFMMQLFHGYGESLADYEHSYWAYRAGIGF